MTRDKKAKRMARARLRATGERYTTARRLEGREHDTERFVELYGCDPETLESLAEEEYADAMEGFDPVEELLETTNLTVFEAEALVAETYDEPDQ